MEIGPYTFVLVGMIEPERDCDGKVKQYSPQNKFANVRALPLNKYGGGPFCKFRISNSFNACGVYALLIAGQVNYIGECLSLSARYNAGYGNISPRNCFKGGQETNCRLNNLIYLAAEEGSSIELWFHQTPNYKAAELDILSIQKWIWNRK